MSWEWFREGGGDGKFRIKGYNNDSSNVYGF